MTGSRPGDLATKAQSDNAVSLDQKVKEVFNLVDELKVCMMTTQREDGELVSRAMWTTDHERDGSLLFFTNNDARKVKPCLPFLKKRYSSPHSSATKLKADATLST